MSTFPAPDTTVELLLEQAAWIRRLARSLVGDPHLADDLTQETWIRALEHPPEPDRPVRGWLATVMRNLAHQARRGEGRRATRERDAAQDERVDPDAVVERATVHRELAEEVLSLGEPYRSTLLLRFFDGHAPAEIARRTGVPLATVKSRLTRGLDELRARLDRRSGGDRSAWLSALVPLLGRHELTPASPLIPLSIGAAVMNVKVLAIVLVSVAAGVALLVARSPEAAEPAKASEIARATEPVSLAAPAATPEQTRTPVPLERDPESPARNASAPAARADPRHAAAAPYAVQGRVIDARSLPIGGVTVQQVESALDEASRRASKPLVLAGAPANADGTFRIEGTGRSGRLIVSDERYCTVLAGAPVREGSVVVVVPGIELAGRVVDEAGRPLEGVRVHVGLPPSLRVGIDAILDHATDETFEAFTDEAGRFAFERAPSLDGARLRAGREGHAGYDEPAPRQSLVDLTLVLARPDNERPVLRGRVVDGNDRPVAGARVACAIDTTTSDERGLFAFDLDREVSFTAQWNAIAARHFGADAVLPTPDRLVALKPGFLPAEARTTERDGSGEPVWPPLVTLRLDREPFAIAGKVVDVDGVALASIQVWIADPTFFGGLGDPATLRPPELVHAETLLAGAEGPWQSVTSDEHGRYRIEGLLDRSYAVEAMDPATLLRTRLEDVRAGDTHVDVTLPTDELYPVLRGRVVSHGGRPVAGVRLHPMNDAFKLRNAGQVISTHHSSPPGKTVVTDAEGRFELTDVPRRLTYLRLDGETTLPLEWGRHVEGGLQELVGEDYDDVTIAVSVRCHFQVVLDGEEPPDEIALLDAEGNELELSEFQGTTRREGPRANLIDGQSATLAVGDEARTLVLYRDGVEVDRIPIELNPAEKTTIRP